MPGRATATGTAGAAVADRPGVATGAAVTAISTGTPRGIGGGVIARTAVAAVAHTRTGDRRSAVAAGAATGPTGTRRTPDAGGATATPALPVSPPRPPAPP